MSTDEDPELRDLIVKCLENNGVLGKIRAQLRANTFLALDQQDDPKVQFSVDNPALLNCASSEDGQIMFSLIREFLTFYNLQYTLSVFDPESCKHVAFHNLKRSDLAAQLGLNVSTQEEPILQTLIRNFRTKVSTPMDASQVNKDTLMGSRQGTSGTKGCLKPETTPNDAENEYDEDFQSSSSISELKNHDIKCGFNQEASVDEELDISASELLVSQGSNGDQDTLDKTTSNSTIADVDHVANVI